MTDPTAIDDAPLTEEEEAWFARMNREERESVFDEPTYPLLDPPHPIHSDADRLAGIVQQKGPSLAMPDVGLGESLLISAGDLWFVLALAAQGGASDDGEPVWAGIRDSGRRP